MLLGEAFAYKPIACLSGHQVEVLEDGWCRAKVEIVQLRYWQHEIHKVGIVLVQSWVRAPLSTPERSPDGTGEAASA